MASERAAFADTHLRVGIYPGPVLVDLPRRVGPAWAREMSLTGNFVDAATALRIGIANHVVAHEELVPFAMELAAAIAEQDRNMVATMRRDWDDSSGDAHRAGPEDPRRARSQLPAANLGIRDRGPPRGSTGSVAGAAPGDLTGPAPTRAGPVRAARTSGSCRSPSWGGGRTRSAWGL